MTDTDKCEVLKTVEGIPEVLFKIIVVGEASVGKSCIMVRAVKDEYKDNYEVTVGAESSTFFIKINGNIVQLQIWDTAGMEKFRSMIKVFFAGSHCALLVYDITRKETFEKLDVWLSMLKETTTPDIKIVLVGNKKDNDKERQVTYEQGKQYEQQNGLFDFVETSAKTGEGVINTFIKVAKALFAEKQHVNSKDEGDTKKLEQAKPKKKGCC